MIQFRIKPAMLSPVLDNVGRGFTTPFDWWRGKTTPYISKGTWTLLHYSIVPKETPSTHHVRILGRDSYMLSDQSISSRRLPLNIACFMPTIQK
jgi:hypothetical protein